MTERAWMLVSAVSALLAGGVIASAVFSAAEAAPAGPAVPVLVELYTSEGCSSCPSADALLAGWAEAQPVEGVRPVVLGFHVDYWNYLGWADPFSRAEFSERQGQANQALGRESSFTPQAVVGGRASVVGSDEGGLRRALLSARSLPAAQVQVSAAAKEGALDVQATVREAPAPAAGDVAEVWAAVTESGLSTDVKRGENAGRTLRHAPVVRRLVRLGQLPSEGPLTARIPLEPAWRPERLQVVAFVQEQKRREILGVATAPAKP